MRYRDVVFNRMGGKYIKMAYKGEVENNFQFRDGVIRVKIVDSVIDRNVREPHPHMILFDLECSGWNVEFVDNIGYRVVCVIDSNTWSISISSLYKTSSFLAQIMREAVWYISEFMPFVTPKATTDNWEYNIGN